MASLPGESSDFGFFFLHQFFHRFVALAGVVAVFNGNRVFNGHAVVRVKGQVEDGVFRTIVISVFLIKLNNHFVAVNFRTFVDDVNAGFLLAVFQLNQLGFAFVFGAAFVKGG